jgi:hypothetical protein
MPKTCLEDGTKNPDDALTCASCGGGSWGQVDDAPLAQPEAATPAQVELPSAVGHDDETEPLEPAIPVSTEAATPAALRKAKKATP